VSSAPSSDPVLGVSSSLVNGDWQWPVHGLRHLPEGQTNGWYIWTGDLSTAADFFKPLHQSHLVQRVPGLERFLALPPGMRFLIAPGHEDVWEDPSLLEVD
jgi:hypothetical protein